MSRGTADYLEPASGGCWCRRRRFWSPVFARCCGSTPTARSKRLPRPTRAAAWSVKRRCCAMARLPHGGSICPVPCARSARALRLCSSGAVLRADAARSRRGARPAAAAQPREACVTLATVARALLEKLARGGRSRGSRDRGGDGSRRAGCGAPRCSPPCRRRAQRRLRRAAGLRVWMRLDEWSEPRPGAAARQRAGAARGGSLAARRACSAPAPSRVRSKAITPRRSPPPLLRATHPDQPQAVLAEAGTGVGKTLGYIAAASLWAEKNRGSVWISTFTRNLQTQIASELDRLYPDPARQAPPCRRSARGGRISSAC